MVIKTIRDKIEKVELYKTIHSGKTNDIQKCNM